MVKGTRVYKPEFFRRCPSSQRRRPIWQFVKCTVKVLNVSYETIITKKADHVSPVDPSSQTRLTRLRDVPPAGRNPACHLLEQLGLPTFTIYSQGCNGVLA